MPSQGGKKKKGIGIGLISAPGGLWELFCLYVQEAGEKQPANTIRTLFSERRAVPTLRSAMEKGTWPICTTST